MGYSYILDTALTRTRWRIKQGVAAGTCAFFDRAALVGEFEALEGARHILIPQSADESVLLIAFPDGHRSTADDSLIHCVMLPRPGSSGRLDGF